MPDNSFHGISIGAKSLESEDSIKYAERVEIYYDCPNNHITIIEFSTEADIPQNWECRCGALAIKRNLEPEDETQEETKRIRTHWDIVKERRSKKELNIILKKRLEMLRSGEIKIGI